ncbi:porin [Pararobbsia silviterrae]|uniref:Porin n=1 Tax=Pararobbsia silviterrae TaxID=1792498 RepID=A0A494XXI0_9BURK|nr:porin [Pararobbsia silviterrae]RKP54625.1 porin [Pararobbsia silviterrae]
MKKSLVAFAIGCVAVGSASAQNSVELYGVLDEGVTYLNNVVGADGQGHGLLAMQSGVLQGSRWGLKGTEDLGGGLKTIFQLESGFDVSSGNSLQHDRLFGRQAFVGLQSDSWGAVTLGRQYDSVVDYVQPTTMNGYWGAMFSHAGDIDNSDNGFRVDNAIKYTSPTISGLQFGGLYALGGVAGSFGTDSTVAAGASYTGGPLYIGVGYLYARNPVAQFNDGNWSAFGGDPFFGLLGNSASSPSNMQVVGGGGTYQFGPALFGADYTNSRYDDALGGATASFDNYELWGQYQLTPAATLVAGYTYTRVHQDAIYSDTVPKYGQVNFMADYSLSKRTDVYFQGIWQRAYTSDPLTGQPLSASIYTGFPGNASSTNNQVSARVGIRTKF